LTIGVNPSSGEFEDDRWAGISSFKQAEERIVNYFENPHMASHPWFETWESALNQVDASYYGKRRYLAAHLDLCPRPTLPMSKVDPERFLEMVITDLSSFIQFLN